MSYIFLTAEVVVVLLDLVPSRETNKSVFQTL